MKAQFNLTLLAAMAALGSQAVMAQDAAKAPMADAMMKPADTMMKPADANTLVDGLEGVFGKHAGFRRSGAKGICASGTFTGNKDGKALSAASAFSGKEIPVILRFSVGGGNPKAPENAKSVRGMAAQFKLPKGEEWLMANISTPVFTAATPDSFQAFLDARKPDPATGKPNPEKVAAATAANPDHKVQADFLKGRGVPASYGAVNYWGVHAFKFVNAKGKTQVARWVFEPVAGEEFIADDKVAGTAPDFLPAELRSRVSIKPVEYNFKLQLAEAGDPTNNPTVVWPAERKTVVAGQLKITAVEAEGSASCDGINFNPLALPKGIEISDDPVLLARAGAYAVSQGRRLSK